MRPLALDLHLRVIDELGDRLFLALPPESASYYDQKQPLFGGDVESKFPQMSEDIAEAGKCLALNRSTAAVFHLMRVMEIAVQTFGTKIGIALASEKMWQNTLDEVNKAIKGLNPKAPLTQAYAATASHLYNVKVCWRNPTMHPKQTYTPEEARKIFDAVKTFTDDLVNLI